jgi:integrase/recombinase XerD
MKPTDFAIRLSAFFLDYLPAQRNVSPNTVRAYRDTFRLLVRFCRDVRDWVPERLRIEQIDPQLVLDFLRHLEADRHCGARTRNHRLAALHTFFRYMQTEEPERLEQCQRILALPFQRCPRAAVAYLPAEDLAAILAQPERGTRKGRRDVVLLSLLYDTGARVQEIIDLRVGDVRLDSPAQVTLHGKGRKTRAVPLMSSTVRLLRTYWQEHGLDQAHRKEEPLFKNRDGSRLSRSGVRYILQSYVAEARRTRPNLHQRVSPHTLRHTKAMHLLECGNSLVVIRDFLGHCDIGTTEVYLRANPKMQQEALDKLEPEGGITPSMPSWKSDKGLLEWLTSL